MELPIVLSESVLTFAEAVEACRIIAGRKPSVSSIYAWADLGVKVGGQRVKLECARLGGRRVTSREAVERFIAACAGAEEPAQAACSPASRRRGSDRAIAWLRKEFAQV